MPFPFTGKLPKEHYSTTTTRYRSAMFHKGYRLYFGVRVNGQKAVLQGPGSDVQLHIPEGLYGFISGHANTDPTPFLDHIPESERLVSPIAEYNCSFTGSCPKGLFEIKVPHCVRNRKQFQHIRVWHGDVYNKIPFYEKRSFMVDEKYITINIKE